MQRHKAFRKRKFAEEDDQDEEVEGEDIRSTLEEVRILQKQRERSKGIGAEALGVLSVASKVEERKEDDPEAGQHALEDTFAQETAVEKEDPNMLRYIEQEMAKRRGLDVKQAAEAAKSSDADLYVVPDHLKVRKKGAEENGQAWATGIAEVQLSIDFKLKNIEETEMAKKHLQEKRPYASRNRNQEATMPASYSADYFQRGREYAERLRREHPDLYKDGQGGGRGGGMGGGGGRGEGGGGGGGEPRDNNRRQAATDEIMLERFRKRERNRMMRR